MREYRFLEFCLQPQERRLLTPDGRAVELTPRLYDALLFLVEHPGELLGNDRLMAELWPGLVVEENSLSQSISALRRALGDEAQHPRFIQTVPRHGFRFVAPVSVHDGPLQRVAAEVISDITLTALTPPSPPSPPSPFSRPLPPVPEPVLVAPALAHATRPGSSHRRTWLAGVATSALLATAGGVAAWRWRAPGSATGVGTQTLAVLPFKPIVGGAGDELLELGMAESLVSRLSNLPGVAVRSVGSVQGFRGAEQDPIDAARELNVTWIVDGSVQRVGARVRVSARLLNTTNGEAAWSGSFDEDYTGVFALQDSISAKVAQVLAPHLERDGRRRLAGAGGTRHVEAYQLYLFARQSAQGIKTAGLVKSIDLYRQAIALDPAYAQAWSGLAESHRRLVFGADGEPRVVLAESARASQRAVQLDPGSAEAHAGVGWNRFWRDWDWSGAQASFDRALVLNASEANAHFGYSQLLEMLGRRPEALEHLRLARESDPMSPLILLTLESGSLLRAGRAEEARQRLQRVFDMAPDFWVAHMVQSAFQLSKGQTEEALASLAQADQLADGSSQAAAALGYALARNGQADRARAILQRLVDQSKSRYVPPTSTGLIHAGLGDKAAAMAALEAGNSARDVRMTLVWNDGRWNLVRAEPRFAALRASMNLV